MKEEKSRRRCMLFIIISFRFVSFHITADQPTTLSLSVAQKFSILTLVGKYSKVKRNNTKHKEQRRKRRLDKQTERERERECERQTINTLNVEPVSLLLPFVFCSCSSSFYLFLAVATCTSITATPRNVNNSNKTYRPMWVLQCCQVTN